VPFEVVSVKDASNVSQNIVVDDISGVGKVQVIKVGFGTDGAIVGVESSAPLPVTGPLTDTQLRATPVPVADGGGSITVDNAGTFVVQVSNTVVVTGSVGVTGTVAVSGSVAVTGPLTDTQLRATAVPISVASIPTHAVTQSGTWNVGINVALPAGTNNIGDVDVLSLPPLPAGTNNIGDVDVLTLPSLPAGTNNIGDVDVLTLPALAAGTNLIGQIIAANQTGTIYSGTTALTVKYAIINAAALGNTQLVAGVATKKLRVLSFRYVADADVSVKFRSATAGDLTGAMATGAKGGGGGAAFSSAGHFETVAGEALQINLSGNVQVSGHLAYVEV
jgi:hypothetical protein